jgi:hypothetical protein
VPLDVVILKPFAIPLNGHLVGGDKQVAQRSQSSFVSYLQSQKKRHEKDKTERINVFDLRFSSDDLKRTVLWNCVRPSFCWPRSRLTLQT